MNERVNTFALAAAIAESDGPIWIKVLPAGRFAARDGRGPFDAGDLSELQAIVARSLAYAGATDVVIDYDHQTIYSAVPGTGGRAEASGWIKELQAREDGIYARVEWTAAAAAKIQAGEYRYVSPYFTSHKTSGRVGKLVNVALTNVPALDLAAIAASANLFEEEDVSMNAIAKALGLADNASPEAILAAITGNQQKIAAAAGLKADATFDAIVASVTGAVAAVGKVAKAAGLKAEATVDEVVTALSTSATQTVPMSMFNDVKDQLNALRTTVENGEVEQLITAAINEGKVTPASEAWARNYCATDRKGFKDFIANAPVLTKSQLGDKSAPAGGVEMDANALAAKAVAYQAEQLQAGVTVSISDAVTHVEALAKAGK